MIKTILMHVDGSPAQDSRLHAAALLANTFDAHLVGSADTGIGWPDYAKWMVGGVTRELLERSRVPLLLAH
ncbi:hypothetical protein GCM10025794_10240 [Massilia kyonggiensis]|nr:hypothetical protein [Massilia kyonggiensis]